MQETWNEAKAAEEDVDEGVGGADTTFHPDYGEGLIDIFFEGAGRGKRRQTCKGWEEDGDEA